MAIKLSRLFSVFRGILRVESRIFEKTKRSSPQSLPLSVSIDIRSYQLSVVTPCWVLSTPAAAALRPASMDYPAHGIAPVSCWWSFISFKLDFRARNARDPQYHVSTFNSVLVSAVSGTFSQTHRRVGLAHRPKPIGHTSNMKHHTIPVTRQLTSQLTTWYVLDRGHMA